MGMQFIIKINNKLKNLLNINFSPFIIIVLSVLLIENLIIPSANAVDSSNKNITYMQILQNPNDLDLNLKYAQQQGKMGNHKQTISTLERLNMLYPDNIEIKLYLLSVLVQADSPEKAIGIIDDIKLRKDVSAEDLESVIEIEEELKGRSEPKLWNFYADISAGVIHTDNVNSVSKTRKQMSSDSKTGFNTAKHDRTLSGGLGLTATRSIGEASSFMINASHTKSEQYQETGDDKMSIVWKTGAAAERFRFKNKKRKKRQASSNKPRPALKRTQLNNINKTERNNMKKVKSIKDLQRLMETLGAKKETGDGWASWTIDAGPGRWTHTDLSKLQASSLGRKKDGQN